MIFYKYDERNNSFVSYGMINENLEIALFDIDIPGKTVWFRPSLLDRIRIRVYEKRKERNREVVKVRVMDILKRIGEAVRVTFEGAKYEVKHRRKDG